MENAISKKIISAAIEVHRHLGPGLLESIYESALCHELELQKLTVKKQVPIAVQYKNCMIRDPLYLDILVEDKVIIEVIAQEKNNPLFQNQTLTYLKLTNLKLGLVINFGMLLLKEGICRVVNGL